MDTLAVRLPDELLDGVEAYIGAIKKRFPHLNISRADAVRQLLSSGIEVEGERLGFKAAVSRPPQDDD